MKKTIVFLLSLVAVAILLLAGCGSEERITEAAAPVEETTTVSVEQTPAQSSETAEETSTETTEESAISESMETTSTESSSEETIYEGASVAGCVDSDGGKNYDLVGSIVDARGVTDKDRCSENENFPGKLYESYCQEDGNHGRETYDCPSEKCSAGACVAVE